MQNYDSLNALRQMAEEKLDKIYGAVRDTNPIALGPDGTKRIIHDLRVHQIELEMQNENLRLAQQAMEASRARFINLYDFAPVGYATVTESGMIQEANLTVAGLLGVNRGELLMKPLSYFVLPEDQGDYYQAIKVLFTTGKAQKLELRMRCVNGPPFWALLEAVLAEYSNGTPVIRVMISNNTERKEAEIFRCLSIEVLKILNEAEDFKTAAHRILSALVHNTGCDAAGMRFKDGDDFPYYAHQGFSSDFLLAENSLICPKSHMEFSSGRGACVPLEGTCGKVILGQADPGNSCFTPGGSFWINDLQSHIDQCAHTQKRCIQEGYSSLAIVPVRARKEIVGLLQINGQLKDRFRLDVVQALENIAVHIGWAWMRKKDQEKLSKAYAELELRVQERTAELSVANVALKAEIEERKHAEEALQLANAYNRSLIEASLDPLVTIGQNGKITDVNQGTEKATGYRRTELIGTDFADYFTEPERARAGYRHVFREGQVRDYALDLRHKDGSVMPVLYNASVYRSDSGEVLGVFAAARDITERKKAEEDKIEFEAKYRQLQKAESLGRMAGGIAHKFNNMLSVVMGHLELSMDSVSEIPEIGIHLTEARKAAQNASEVSRMMLTYLGQAPSQLQPMDLSSVCRRNLTKLQSAMPDEVVFETELPSSGPTIKANEFQIKQVMINLVTNAWESLAEGRGGVQLTVKTVSSADIPDKHRFPPEWKPQDKPYACLEVRDTGSGITPEAIEILFDPFYSSKFTGRGLGLAVVIGLVRAHSGAVTVESHVGRGSIFRVFFPVLDDGLLQQTEKKAITQENKQGLTVLLVEDEYSVRKMTQEILMRMGFTVLEAKDGIEALEVFQKHKESIHCVLSDVAMPRMDGWQTLTALRRINPDISVILTSGYDVQSMAGDHKDLPQAFLSKPFQLKALRETIQKVTNQL